MSAITEAELRPGLCAFLDPAVLLGCPGCRANVRARANLVNRPGPFLLLEEMAEGSWLCVPLVSHGGPGREALERRLKSGPGNGWRQRDSFYSVHQFWVVPGACVAEASAQEISPLGNRQVYAEREPAALDAVARHRFDSDAPYRPVTELR